MEEGKTELTHGMLAEVSSDGSVLMIHDIRHCGEICTKKAVANEDGVTYSWHCWKCGTEIASVGWNGKTTLFPGYERV